MDPEKINPLISYANSFMNQGKFWIYLQNITGILSEYSFYFQKSSKNRGFCTEGGTKLMNSTYNGFKANHSFGNSFFQLFYTIHLYFCVVLNHVYCCITFCDCIPSYSITVIGTLYYLRIFALKYNDLQQNTI